MKSVNEHPYTRSRKAFRKEIKAIKVTPAQLKEPANAINAEQMVALREEFREDSTLTSSLFFEIYQKYLHKLNLVNKTAKTLSKARPIMGAEPFSEEISKRDKLARAEIEQDIKKIG